MIPLVSILVSTYNRKELLQRALQSIYAQTFTDYEIILIDDQSTDGTMDAVYGPFGPDIRMKYIYNEKNQAGEHGDKIHIKRFVHELAKGKYWIYLDSDDQWLKPDLLETQIKIFKKYPGASMVTGAQESHFIPEDEKVFVPGVFPEFMTSDQFLKHFAERPIECNIIGGARLYNREMFINSGALVDNAGRWEAGFELTLAPVCYGSHIYIDEPCIRTDIRPENASFNETQLMHYQDSVAGVRAGFRKPIIDFPERGLEEIQRLTIENIGKKYLENAKAIKAGQQLSYCSKENTSRYVTPGDLCL